MTSDGRARAGSRWAWSAAVCASAAVILGSPLIGTLRVALLRAWPAYYIPVLRGGVALGVALLLAISVATIRRHRALRYGALVLALGLGSGAAFVLRSGNANVDAVEAFHFVEYGALTLLFFQAHRHRSRADAYGRAALSGIVVGIVDEGLQWFVPGRAGELHDILFDAVAVACGLLLCVALDAWEPAPRARPGAATRLTSRAALTVLLLAAFVATVHLGYEIRDDEIGAFRSRFSAARLQELGDARARGWTGGPPPAAAAYGREDQYLAEALWHVRRRNEGMDPDREGNPIEKDIAWRENRILEIYFGAVLDAPPAPGAPGHRLADEQRAALQTERAPQPVFSSDANPAPIYPLSPVAFWLAAGAVAAAIAVSGALLDRRASRAV